MILALLATSLTSGLLLAGALRVHGLLAWVVAAPIVFLAGERLRWRHVILVGATFGAAGATAAHADWLAQTAQRYFTTGDVFAWIAALSLTLVTGVTEGIVLALGLRCALSQPDSRGIVAAAAMWAVWEWFTLQWFPFYPWASLAAAQADLPLALSAAGILGQPGLTLAIVGTGLCLGRALLRSHHRSQTVALGSTLIFLVLCLGVVEQHRQASPAEALCTIDVIDARQREPSTGLEPYLRATRRAAFDWHEPATAVVWPESALPASPEMDAEVHRSLARLSSEVGAVLIAGGPGVRWDDDWTERRFNSAFRIDPGGAVERYDKRRLVPFAEYWPWTDIAPPAVLRTRYVEAGATSRIFQAGRCRLGVLICFEAERPELARELAESGADALLVLSNDANLPAAEIAMEAAQARLRAAETGLPVIRVANAGASFAAGAATTITSPAGDLRVGVAARRIAPAVALSPILLGACFVLGAFGVLRGVRRLRASTTAAR